MVGKFTDVFDPEGFSIIRFIEGKDIKMAYSGESWFFQTDKVRPHMKQKKQSPSLQYCHILPPWGGWNFTSVPLKAGL